MTLRNAALASALIATVLHLPAVHAAALGEVRTRSGVGEPFRVEIELLRSQSAADAACFRVVPPTGASDGMPQILAAETAVIGSGRNTRLVVSSRTAVSAPVVRLVLENTCSAYLQREFTLILPIALAKAPSAPLLAPAAPPAPVVRAPRPSPRTPPPGEPAAATSVPARSAAPAPTPGPAELAVREQDLSAAVARNADSEADLLARIDVLETRRRELEQSLRGSDATPAAAPPTSAGPATPAAPTLGAAPAASAPPPTTAPAAAGAAASAPADDHLATTVALLVALVLVLVALRRRLTQGRRGLADDAVSTATTTEPASNAVAHAAPAQLRADANPAEHKSAIELARIMMSFGRMQGAAEILAEFVHANPRQSVQPWLVLLEAYRGAGLRDEFEVVASELNKTFNVVNVAWDNYDEVRRDSRGIEDLPHVIGYVCRGWSSAKCLDYLVGLLADNRGGGRNGLPLHVVDDILTLIMVLEDRLGVAAAAPAPTRVG